MSRGAKEFFLALGAMLAYCVLCGVLAAIFLVVVAHAQAQLPPGYTAGSELVDTPMFGLQKDCQHGRAKLLRWHLQDYYGVTDRQSVKFAVCAHDGHVYWSNRVDNRYDGNRGRWTQNGQIIKSGGRCCGNDGRYAHTDAQWAFHGVITQFWTLDLQIQAHVGGPGRGPNDIWFSKWSRFQ